jgi:hypothetical protein
MTSESWNLEGPNCGSAAPEVAITAPWRVGLISGLDFLATQTALCPTLARMQEVLHRRDLRSTVLMKKHLPSRPTSGSDGVSHLPTLATTLGQFHHAHGVIPIFRYAGTGLSWCRVNPRLEEMLKAKNTAF